MAHGEPVKKTKALPAAYAGGLAALSLGLVPQVAYLDEHEVFKMTELARDYWLYGLVSEALCGARMMPNVEEMAAAVEQGNYLAAYRLGQLYETGAWGVEKAGEDAVRWYKVAAEGKIYNAMINLAMMYELGRGAQRDLTKARRWFMEAQSVKYDKYIAQKIDLIEAELNEP